METIDNFERYGILRKLENSVKNLLILKFGKILQT